MLGFEVRIGESILDIYSLTRQCILTILHYKTLKNNYTVLYFRDYNMADDIFNAIICKSGSQCYRMCKGHANNLLMQNAVRLCKRNISVISVFTILSVQNVCQINNIKCYKFSI